MATQVQLRRGTTGQISSFSGAVGELVVDTDIKTLYLQDGSTAGGFAMARADFSNIAATATLTLATLNATTLNTTNLDLTNLEVTNIKAKDGTAAGSIADSTGVVTIASAVLTTADINAGTFDGVVGGTTPAAGSFTTLSGSTSITGTLATAAQANITSVGTLTALTVSGDAVFTPDNDGVRITGTNYATLRLEESDTTDENATLWNSSGDFVIATTNDARSTSVDRFRLDHATGDIGFYNSAGTTQSLFWDASAGSLGINSTSPSGQLVVAASDGGNGIETQVTSHATNKQFILAYDRAGSAYLNMEISALSFGIATNNGTTALHIDTSQRVGLKTSSPSSYYANDLVVAAADEGGITIASSATTHRGIMAFADATSGDGRYAGYTAYDHNTDAMTFHTGGAGVRRLTIDSAGRVGIGVTPEAWSSTWEVLQVGARGAVISQNGDALQLAENSYNDGSGSWKAIATGSSSFFSLDNGGIQMYTAPSVSADANQTFSYVMNIDNAGHVTKPLQPAFNVRNSTSQFNIAINTDVTVVWGTVVFDVGSNFASNQFTAPVTGKYQLNTNVRWNQMNTAHDYVITFIKTTLRTYYSIIDPDGFEYIPAYFTQNVSVLADMDEGDTAYVYVYCAGGSATSDIDSGPGSTTFSGYLVA